MNNRQHHGFCIGHSPMMSGLQGKATGPHPENAARHALRAAADFLSERSFPGHWDVLPSPSVGGYSRLLHAERQESVGHLPFFDRSTTMIKVEVGQEEVGDVFRLETMTSQRSFQCWSMRLIVSHEFLILLITHATVDQDLSFAGIHQRHLMAQVHRLFSSAGTSFCHIFFGTTPNIAPPSSLK